MRRASTKPEDPQKLLEFYTKVRPCKKTRQFRASSFKRDAINTAIGLVWQVTLWTIPVYAVLRDLQALAMSLGVFVLTSALLKRNWLDKVLDEA